MQPDRFNNRKYGNWVKNSLSLLYLKEGITNFSNEKAGEFHQKVTELVRLKSPRSATTKCTKCTHKSAKKAHNNTTWRMNCSSNVCSVWLEEILPYHSHLPPPNIAWANSNPQLWPSDVWEIAKLFQPYGCETHSKAEDSDCTALLTLMLNCTYFHKFLTNTARLREIKDVRNACMHSRDQEIDDQDMTNALDLMVALLEEPFLKNRPECITAKTKIVELRDNALELSLNKDLEIRALNNRLAEVRIDFERLDAEHQQMKADLNNIADRQDSTLDEYKNRMSDVKQKIAEMTENWKSIQQTHDPSLGVKVDDLASKLQDLQKKTQTDYEDLFENVHATMGKIETRLHDIETQKAEEKQQKEDNLQRTTRDLLHLYSDHRLKVQIFPLRKEDIKDLYVKQSLIEVAQQGMHVFNDESKSKNAETKIEHVRDILSSGEKSYRDVYIVGESGTGKSTLCQYLIYLWVKKHSEGNSEAGKLKDEDFMGDFSLLFYISLREANSKTIWDIEDMITDQFSVLKLTKEDISKLMSDYTCLIILDGLDEYWQTHPNCAEYVNESLPWRQNNLRRTILTTSRPWKMELLASEQGVKIDKQIRITGLETKSQENLAKIVITLVNSKDEVKEKKNFNEFIRDMKEQQLDNYMETPILLLQMLGLWLEGESFGKSQCEIYSKLINKQLQFASDVKKVPAATNKEKPHWFGKRSAAEMSSEEENFDAKLPSCFGSRRYCQKYQGLLLKLSKLAYRHLFDRQESALVFDHDQMEIMGLSEEEINTCLHLGLLTQYNVLEKITQRQKSISFVHKSHQEFFAAIYLWQTGLGSDLKQILAKFTNLDGVLQIEKSLNFISGMNTKVACEIAQVIMSLASKDARIQQYRETCLVADAPNEALVQQIQGVILAAIEESRNNGLEMPAIPLQDLWMKGGHRDFSPTRISAVTGSLELSYVKSILIHTPSDIPRDVVQRWVKTPTQLNKLVLYDCDISACGVVDIVKRNRASLQTLGLSYPAGDELDLCRLSRRDLTMILSPTSLALHGVVMSHEQLELIYTHLARRPYTEVLLSFLRCIHHGYDCKSQLDLSTSTELRTLQLYNLPLQDVTYEPRRLLRCQIGPLPDTVAVHVLQRLTEARSLEKFYCHRLTETALVEMVRILPQLSTLTAIVLFDMDLRDQQPIVLHNTTALKIIELWNITLTSSQLPQLLADLPSHSVGVALGRTDNNWPVTITNCDPNYNLIQHLADSPHTKVVTEPEVTYQDDKCVVKVFHFFHKQ